MTVDGTQVPAILLAGGRDKGPLAETTGQTIRGLVPLLGKPMISYVTDALSAAALIGETLAVGPEALKPALGGCRLLPEGESLLANIQAGLAAVPHEGHALLVTADIPLLTPDALDDFIRRGLEMDADVRYPIIPQAANDAKTPGMKRTYVKLREGRFTGGNMMLVKVAAFQKMEPLVQEAYALRKKPLKLGQRLGWGFLLRMPLGLLHIADVETTVGRVLGGKARAVRTNYAEIGADVDKPEDMTLAEGFLKFRSR
jgi:GTP:adenosylcobinamide-phosphate guanylyltransferase